MSSGLPFWRKMGELGGSVAARAASFAGGYTGIGLVIVGSAMMYSLLKVVREGKRDGL